MSYQLSIQSIRLPVFIRADADKFIGTGHIMRCLALAQVMQDKGLQVTFISRCENIALCRRVESEGFRLISIGEQTSSEALINILNDLCKITPSGIDRRRGWIVLDGYHFDYSYQSHLKNAGFHTLVVDDMNHLPRYEADILLNQNLFASRLSYRVNDDVVRLFGTDFAMIRKEFLRYGPDGTAQKTNHKTERKTVLLTMGGADSQGVTLQAIKALKRFEEPEFNLIVVVGPLNPYLDEIRGELETSDLKYELHVGAKDMPGLMSRADYAITAGGSTCWELLYLGVIFIVGIIAENQCMVAESLGNTDWAINCGWYSQLTQDDWRHYVDQLLNKTSPLNINTEEPDFIVDGFGVERIYNCMERWSKIYKKTNKYH